MVSMAEAGDVNAQSYLGFLSGNGEGVSQNDEEAMLRYPLAADGTRRCNVQPMG